MTVEGASADELRDLRAWLVAEEDLRGRVQLVERAPESGRLGPLVEALRVFADPGGVVLASVLVTWVKQHRSSIKATVTGPGGKRVSIEAERVRLMNADDLGELTERVARLTQVDRSSLHRGTTPPVE